MSGLTHSPVADPTSNISSGTNPCQLHKSETLVSALASSTPSSAFNQQSSIKVPHVGYVPGVAVMERNTLWPRQQ